MDVEIREGREFAVLNTKAGVFRYITDEKGWYNARINDAKLTIERDMFTLVFDLTFETGGSVQSLNNLSWPNNDNFFRLDILIGIMKALGVDDFSKLKGQHCRIRLEEGKSPDVGSICKPVEYAHIIKNEWYEIKYKIVEDEQQ